jgi:hypothetical protein
VSLVREILSSQFPMPAPASNRTPTRTSAGVFGVGPEQGFLHQYVMDLGNVNERS